MFKLLVALGLISATQALDLYADSELAAYGEAENQLMGYAFEDDEAEDAEDAEDAEEADDGEDADVEVNDGVGGARNRYTRRQRKHERRALRRSRKARRKQLRRQHRRGYRETFHY